jgi:hypothetical protein
MHRSFRWGLVVIGLIAILFSIGFSLQKSWAIWIWPLQSGRLSLIFVGSILAAIGVPVVWVGLAEETRAMAGGALNLLVTNAGFLLSMVVYYLRYQQPALLFFGIISGIMVILSARLFINNRHKDFVHDRSVPAFVRISFWVFSAILLITALALLFKRPNTFPWPMSAENSVMYGWVFLGAMCYFVYGAIYPVVSNVRGQLLGFLAYDVVLIFPFIAHFQAVRPEMLASLIIYTTVVCVSGLEALYFLLIHPITRLKNAHVHQPRPVMNN